MNLFTNNISQSNIFNSNTTNLFNNNNNLFNSNVNLFNNNNQNNLI